jgi:hypothetical protein
MADVLRNIRDVMMFNGSTPTLTDSREIIEAMIDR